MYIQSSLIFDGKCQQALDYYVSALGAKVEMAMTFCSAPAARAWCFPAARVPIR